MYSVEKEARVDGAFSLTREVINQQLSGERDLVKEKGASQSQILQ